MKFPVSRIKRDRESKIKRREVSLPLQVRASPLAQFVRDISQASLAVASTYQNVVRFNISMNDVERVKMFNSRTNLFEESDCKLFLFCPV